VVTPEKAPNRDRRIGSEDYPACCCRALEVRACGHVSPYPTQGTAGGIVISVSWSGRLHRLTPVHGPTPASVGCRADGDLNHQPTGVAAGKPSQCRIFWITGVRSPGTGGTTTTSMVWTSRRVSIHRPTVLQVDARLEVWLDVHRYWTEVVQAGITCWDVVPEINIGELTAYPKRKT